MVAATASAIYLFSFVMKCRCDESAKEGPVCAICGTVYLVKCVKTHDIDVCCGVPLLPSAPRARRGLSELGLET